MVQGLHAEFQRHSEHCTFRIAILKRRANVYTWYHIDRSCRTERDLHLHCSFLLSRKMQKQVHSLAPKSLVNKDFVAKIGF